ncbi:MAG: hypothetical protein AAGI91_01545 [Bacteroidota bacterium]
MHLERRLRATRLLALAGMLLTVLSYGTYKLGGVSELYPFFHWRLFSEPVGWRGGETYRLYTRPSPEAAWERQALRALPAYSLKDYVYQWEPLVREALDAAPGSPERRETLSELLVFARLTVPEATDYRVVLETFDPLGLLDDPAAYDTTTVLHLTR